MNHYNPVRIVFKPIESVINYIEKGKSYLVVSSFGADRRGFLDVFKTNHRDFKFHIITNTKSNPDLSDLEGLQSQIPADLRAFDGVIGLGGGSVIDTAKYLAFRMINSGRIIDSLFDEDISSLEISRSLPLIAIPTTAGTGSEVTQFATVWDLVNRRKLSITGESLFPKLALIDKKLLNTLDDDNLLYPALDALSHSLDSIWNKNCSPLTRPLSIESMHYTLEGLQILCKNGSTEEGRSKLQIGSILAGLAISQTRTSAAHAFSYQFTYNYGVPHGLACSVPLFFLLEKYHERITTNESEKILFCSVRDLLLDLKLLKRLNEFVDHLVFDDNLNQSRLSNFLFTDSDLYNDFKNYVSTSFTS